MSKAYNNPLSDMGRMKESLMSLFQNSTDITKLAEHCFDTPYIEGSITDNGCAIFIETHLIKVVNQRVKEVGINIYVVCHKDSISLSEEERTYYNSIGIYGNRVDSVVQAIDATLTSPNTMDEIKKNYSIGALTFIEGEPIKEYLPEPDFYGKQMSYTYQSFYQHKSR